MRKVFTFFICLWITLILFGWRPNFRGLSYAVTKAAFEAIEFGASATELLLRSDEKCRDGINERGSYDICIKNNGR